MSVGLGLHFFFTLLSLVLKAFQPCDEILISPPETGFPIVSQQGLGFGQRFAFLVEAQRQILVRRVEVGMAHPVCNRAQVHPGPQQVDGGAVTHAVRMQSFVF